MIRYAEVAGEPHALEGSSSALTGTGNGEVAPAQVKYTPGPWTIDPGFSGWGTIRDAVGRNICGYGSIAFPAAESIANAHLIAAAPVMADTLRWIDQQRYADRGTVTPESAFEAFTKLNAKVCEIYDRARAALASGGKA